MGRQELDWGQVREWGWLGGAWSKLGSSHESFFGGGGEDNDEDKLPLKLDAYFLSPKVKLN